MFNLPFFNQKRQAANKKDAVDGGIKMIGFLAACAFSFSALLITALSYESIHENQSAIVALFLSLPSGLFKAFLIFLAFLSFVALLASITAIKWQRAKSEAFALAKVQETQIVKADQATDSTEQMVKLLSAMAMLNQGGKPDRNLLEALQKLQAPQVSQAPQITVEDPDHDLADFINNEECILIHGPKGSGKTTVLHHLVYRRLYQLNHEVVVIDPHRTPTKWYDADVVGGGRDYETIFEALNGYEEMMDARYDELNDGLVEEGDHPHLTLIIDEYRSIVKAQQKALYKKRYNLDSIPALLTEGRKVNMWIALVSHSKSVKSLGLEGEGDLREGFVFLHLKREKDGSKSATASLNAEPHLECRLCGPAPKGRHLPPIRQKKRSQTALDRSQDRSQDRFEQPEGSQKTTEDSPRTTEDSPKTLPKEQFETPQKMADYMLKEDFDTKEMIRLLMVSFPAKLVSGRKIRDYLGIDRTLTYRLISEIKAEKEAREGALSAATTKIYTPNGHLNGHHN